MNIIDAWSEYWQSQALDSYVRSDTDTAISDCWREFADGLDNNLNLLDFACGNGSLASLLMRTNSDKAWQINGVDEAGISQSALSDEESSYKVKLNKVKDSSSLDFADQTFDVITSQFGLEFTDIEKSIAELSRVLKSGGSVGLLITPATWQVSDATQRQLACVQSVQELGFFDAFKDFVSAELQGQINPDSADANIEAANNHLADVIAKLTIKAEELGDKQVIKHTLEAGNMFFEQRFGVGLDKTIARLEASQQAMLANSKRLEQLLEVQKSTDMVENIKNMLKANGIETKLKNIVMQGVVIAVFLQGKKA